MATTKKATVKKATNVRKKPALVAEMPPSGGATLTADELLDYKVRMIQHATARDALVVWTRGIKLKYKIDQDSVLDIDPKTGTLYTRQQQRQAVKQVN